MLGTLNDLCIELMNGNSIRHADRLFQLSEVRLIDGKYKAIIISDGMIYSHSELATSRELAIMAALKVQQSMGRFCAYKEEKESITSKSKEEQIILQTESKLPKRSLSKKK